MTYHLRQINTRFVSSAPFSSHLSISHTHKGLLLNTILYPYLIIIRMSLNYKIPSLLPQYQFDDPLQEKRYYPV